MASNPLHWSAGWGGVASTDPLPTATDIYLYADAGTGFYVVDSVNGSDLNDGTIEDPYATLVKALTVAGAGDVIFVRRSHTETITATQTIAARIYIIGEGTGTARPTFTGNVASNGDLFALTAPAIIRGIRILESSQSTTGNAIDASAAGAIGARLAYCQFVCGDKDQGTKVAMNTSASFIDECSFTSTGTTHDARPLRALSGARLVTDTTFVGGTYGWANTTTFLFGWGNSASGPIGIGGTSSVSVIQCALSDRAYFDGTATPDYRIYPDGLGLVGHPLIAGAGLFVSSSVRYVNSEGGTDSGSGDWGGSYQRPYDTLKYAVNTAAPTGLIVVEAGHTETVTTAAIVVDQGGCIIVGEGTGDDRPAITRNWDGILVDVDHADGVGICNLRFPLSGTSSSAVRVSVREAGAFVHQCEFDCGANDLGPSISAILDVVPIPDTMGDHLLIDSCTFESVITASTTAPQIAIDSADTDNMQILNCTFDGGQYGWSGGSCAAPAATTLLVENLTLLRGSIFVIEPDNYAVTIDALVQVSTMTGSSGILSQPVV